MANNVFCMPPYIGDEEQLTQITYREIFSRLERIAINVCRWENLPEGLNQQIIERYLFYYGNVVIFYDDVATQYVALPISGEYAWDVNYYPTEVEVMGFQGYHRRVSTDEAVIIYNDYQMNPGFSMASLLATRLTNTLRTGDMHLELQKVGKIIAVPESKKTGVQALLKRIKNFHLYTIGTPAMRELAESTSVLDTELEFIVDKLDKHYSFLWHDSLNFYGVDSMSDKQSGIGQAEVEAESSMARANRSAMMNARLDGVKALNDMFGLNVKVTFVPDVGGEDNVELHNNSENNNGDSNRQEDAGDV